MIFMSRLTRDFMPYPSSKSTQETRSRFTSKEQLSRLLEILHPMQLQSHLGMGYRKLLIPQLRSKERYHLDKTIRHLLPSSTSCIVRRLSDQSQRLFSRQIWTMSPPQQTRLLHRPKTLWWQAFHSRPSLEEKTRMEVIVLIQWPWPHR